MGRTTVVAMAWLATVGCTGTVVAPGGTAETTAPQTTVQLPVVGEVIRRMNERYTNASTYSDEATLTQTYRHRDGRTSTTTAAIQTRWRRPDRFFIDMRTDSASSDRRLTVWSKGGVTKGWFLERVENHESLDMALYAYQGVSHGVTALVPRWLAGGSRRTRLDFALAADAACGASMCFVLASTTGARVVTLMVDRDTYAVRRYHDVHTIVPDPAEHARRDRRIAETLPADKREEFLKDAARRSVEPFEVEQRIDFTPVFDAPLADSAFDFTPPVPAPSP